jgi:hypothetical protein
MIVRVSNANKTFCGWNFSRIHNAVLRTALRRQGRLRAKCNSFGTVSFKYELGELSEFRGHCEDEKLASKNSSEDSSRYRMGDYLIPNRQTLLSLQETQYSLRLEHGKTEKQTKRFKVPSNSQFSQSQNPTAEKVKCHHEGFHSCRFCNHFQIFAIPQAAIRIASGDSRLITIAWRDRTLALANIRSRISAIVPSERTQIQGRINVHR